MWSIIVHGGAGAIRDALREPHEAGCRRAAEAGAEVLGAGGSSLDAVCAAARVLEDDPVFNAAIGAALDARGLVTVDAAVMRGSDLAYGAVGAVAGVVRAAELARRVLEDGRHSLLVGPGAVAFARKVGVHLVDPDRLRTDGRTAEWTRRLLELERPGPESRRESEDDLPRGTIGAVARDKSGVISAATSTGGVTAKYPGRVGDSPIAGAGTYARDDLGGLSATGHGETMMRTVFAYQTLLALATPSGDASGVIRAELDRATAKTGGKGGAIVVLRDGRVAWARNTAHMGVAWVREGGVSGTDF